MLLSALPSLLEPFEAEAIPAVPSCCPSWQFSSCLSCEESPGYLEQLIDSCLQSDVPSEPALSAFQPSHYTPEPFQPLQLCFNQGLVSFGIQGGQPQVSPRGQGVTSRGRTAAMWEFGCFQAPGMLMGSECFPKGSLKLTGRGCRVGNIPSRGPGGFLQTAAQFLLRESAFGFGPPRSPWAA